jgi:signal transduction histidine kinase
LLKDTPLNQEQFEYLHISEVCCGQLMAIINDILDFTKMETENMVRRFFWREKVISQVLESVPFNLHTLLEDTLELISYNAEQKDIELICDIDDNVPRVIYSDPTRLRNNNQLPFLTSLGQIVVNLLSNAVKFSNGNGEVLLKCRKVSKFEEICTLEFSVSDQGIGIPDSAKPFIYTPFVQADTSVTRKYGGSGNIRKNGG